MNFLMKLAKDKLGHMVVGLIIFSVLVVFVKPFVALIVTLLTGAGKEIYDLFYRDKHTPDIWDFVATTIIPIVLFILYQIKG